MAPLTRKTGYIKPEHKTRSRSKKERIFRHMAREVPDYKIVFLDRDVLADEVDKAGLNPYGDSYLTFFFEKYLGNWERLVKIKHGQDTPIEIFSEYDVDFNRYRLGGRLASENWAKAPEGSVSL